MKDVVAGMFGGREMVYFLLRSLVCGFTVFMCVVFRTESKFILL